MSRRRPPRREERPAGGSAAGGATPARFVTDPETGSMAEVHRVQPYQAVKGYLCPGCNQEIRPGTLHLVVVPMSEPGGRRHWHAPCFERRARGSGG